MLMIDIEGIDGSGKTTALQELNILLQQQGLSTLTTREVGSPHVPVCYQLRKLILNPEYRMDGASMELVFSAMRIENQRFYQFVSDKYDVILSDRGWLSHLAYTDHNTSPSITEHLYINFVGKLTKLPDMIIYIDTKPTVAKERCIQRGLPADAIECKGIEFQQKVYQSFADYIERYRAIVPIHIVDNNGPSERLIAQLDAIAALIKNYSLMEQENNI